MFAAKQKRLLAVWKEFATGRMLRRLGQERAAIHSHRCLLWKCFVAWYGYHQLALRKMVGTYTLSYPLVHVHVHVYTMSYF